MKTSSSAPSPFDWIQFVKNASRNELEKIVFEMSPSCPDIIEKYRMANLPTDTNLFKQALKDKIDSVIAIADDLDSDEFGDYWDRYHDYPDEDEASYSEALQQLSSALDALAEQQAFDVLFELAEYGIDKMMESQSPVEQYSTEFLEVITDFYIQAVRAGIGVPEHLIERFSAWEKGYALWYSFDLVFDAFPIAVKNVWYEQARVDWEILPEMTSDTNFDNDDRQKFDERLYAVAKQRQEYEFAIRILEKNLSCSRNVLKLVEDYRVQNQSEKILPLLIESHIRDSQSVDIRNALIEEYILHDDTGSALKVAWDEFTSNYLSQYAYLALMEVAKRLRRGKAYFEKVLTFLAQCEKRESLVHSSNMRQENARTRQISILLEAGDNQRAWDLAQGVKCSEELQLKLAKWRSEERPDQASQICNGLLERAMQPTGDDAYDHVIQLLKLYKKYMRKAGEFPQFQAYCRWIRSEYKRRRNLIHRLDKHGF